MVTLTLGEVGSPTTRSGGVVRRTLKRMISAREAQGRRHSSLYVLTLDDATLAAYGVDRSALSRGIDAQYPL